MHASTGNQTFGAWLGVGIGGCARCLGWDCAAFCTDGCVACPNAGVACCCGLAATGSSRGEADTAAAEVFPFLVVVAGFGSGAIDCVLKLASLRACAAASTPPGTPP